MTDTRHKMEVQRRAKSSSSASRSSALNVKVGSATSCSPVTISWDASSGKGPWTIMIAPINFTPITISVPNASGSQAQFSWNVPNYSSRSSTTAFVAVSDASGDVSGVSSKISIGASSSSCSGPSTSLDFVWYPTSSSKSPAQCADWTIAWQKDNSNNGIVSPVTFTFLPENGTPLTVSAGSTSSSGGRFDFTVPWSSGTEFAAIANDAGSAGTGGVGDLYSVSSGRSSCSAASNIGNGLPSAQMTSSAIAPSATATSSSTKATGGKTSASAASSTSNSGSAFPNQATAGSSSGQSHVGTAVGATFGVLAGLAVIFGLLWYLRRRSRERASPFEKGGDQPGISPWRWSASPYEAPATNSRASRWLGKASSIAPAKGLKVLADFGGHGHSNSTSYSMNGAQTHVRQRSSMSQGFSDKSQSPTQTFGQNGQGNPTFRNVVPDTALFPPPRPMGASQGDGVYGSDHYDGAARVGNSADYYFGIGHPGQPGAVPPPKRKPVSSGPDGYPPYYPNGTPSEDDYSGEVSPSRTNTSDPFSNAAAIDQNVVTHEIQRGAQHQYSAPQGVTSEIMMPDGSYRSAPGSNVPVSEAGRRSRNSEDGLPYL